MDGFDPRSIDLGRIRRVADDKGGDSPEQGGSGTPGISRAGMPNPRTRIISSSGMPRTRSTYTTASARIGKKTGPRRDLAAATIRAAASISTSATTNICTSSQKPLNTAGQTSWKCRALKNCSRTLGQVSDERTARTATPTKTTVEAVEIRTTRTPSFLAFRRQEGRRPVGRLDIKSARDRLDLAL